MDINLKIGEIFLNIYENLNMEFNVVFLMTNDSIIYYFCGVYFLNLVMITT